MKTKIVVQLALVACLGICGCAGVKNTMRESGKKSSWNPLAKLTAAEKEAKKEKDKKDAKEPQTMAIIWKDSVLEKPGVPTVKGFGGRIFFYDEENKPVKAEGELVIYGFDDSQKTEEGRSPKADRKFVFRAEQFQSHFSETDLGASYSVWVPWEKVGGYRKTIVLIPIFKTAEGNVLKSGQSINVLPGKNPGTLLQSGSNGDRTEPLAGQSMVRQAGFESQGDHNAAQFSQVNHEEAEYNRTRIRTSTIQLTPAMAARLTAPTPVNPISIQQVDDSKSDKLVAQKNAEANSETPTIKAEFSQRQPTASDNAASNRASSPNVFGSPGSFR